jgi:hypothetical protein
MPKDLGAIAFDNTVDIDAIRERLRTLTDTELIRYGKDCVFLCSPKQNFGKPPLEVWALQLREARAEWTRRHPAVGKP